jgi:hypothetical protein
MQFMGLYDRFVLGITFLNFVSLFFLPLQPLLKNGRLSGL